MNIESDIRFKFQKKKIKTTIDSCDRKGFTSK